MPTYCYTSEDGSVFEEHQFPMGGAPWTITTDDGVEIQRDLVAEHSGQRSGDAWTNHESLALMAHPADIPAYVKDAKEKGLPVPDFNPQTGYLRFKSRSEQRRYLKAYGMVNMDDY